MKRVSVVAVAVAVAVACCEGTFTHPYYRRSSSNSCPGTTTLSKLYVNQSDYVQYTQYDTRFPSLTSFSMHYWFNLVDASTTSTMFNYGLDERSTNNNLTVQLEAGRPQHWTMQVNDVLVSRAPSPPIAQGEWHYALHSWHSGTGQWSLFLNGSLVATDYAPQSVGLVVPGGGVAVSGQHQNTALTQGMDQGEGLEGWFTLFHMSSRPVINPASVTVAATMARLPTHCARSFGDDVISWWTTPRRGYGGITETPTSSEFCGHF